MDINRESMGSCENIKPLRIMPYEERLALFDWRKKGENIPSKIVFEEPFTAIENYLANSPYVYRFLRASETRRTGSPI